MLERASSNEFQPTASSTSSLNFHKNGKSLCGKPPKKCESYFLYLIFFNAVILRYRLSPLLIIVAVMIQPCHVFDHLGFVC